MLSKCLLRNCSFLAACLRKFKLRQQVHPAQASWHHNVLKLRDGTLQCIGQGLNALFLHRGVLMPSHGLNQIVEVMQDWDVVDLLLHARYCHHRCVLFNSNLPWTEPINQLVACAFRLEKTFSWRALARPHALYCKEKVCALWPPL